MKRKDEIRKELEEIGSEFHLPEKEGFSVPHNYFEQLSEDILEQVGTQPQVAQQGSPSWSERIDQWLAILFQPQFALATVAILLVAGFILWNNSPTTEGIEPTEIALVDDTLSDEEIQNYIVANIDDFDLEALASDELITFTDLNEEELYDDYIDELIEEMDETDLEDLL